MITSIRLQLKITLTFIVVLASFNNVLLGQISYEEAYPNLSFSFPVEIQNANDGSNRIFIVEQPGLIKVFPNDPSATTAQVSTFLDLSSKVAYSSGQEIGLLGLAFHPNFNSNGYFYVYYTDRPGDYRINLSRFTVDSGNPNIANISSELLIASFTKNQNNSNHNGGKIAFGPDGYLYISVGDGGGAYDPQGNAQNLNNIFGSFLRIDIDVNGDNPIEINPEAPDGRYEIPSENPLVGQSGLDELYAWGIRNTWKFSFDGDTLFGADVGQDELEEINIIENGANYGWNRFEGNTTAVSSTSLITNPDTKPIFQYGHSNGDKSITGGYVYRGAISNTSIQGKYIYGDYITGRVWALDYNQSNSTATNEFLFRTNGQLISTFGLDEFGELYFSGYGNSAKIYKITDESPGPITNEVIGVGEWDQIGNNGINGVIETIVNDGSDNYYIGGEFTNASGISVSNIAKYSKTNGWEALGTGSNGKVSSIAINGNGEIYVGGDFSTINGVSASNVAKFDGVNWTPLGSGTNGPVSKIGIDTSDKVYVTGAFTTAGAENVNNIALWENDSWSALTDATNSITGTNNEIRAIAFDENNNVYVGGNFDSAGGNSAPRIARWDGTNWSTLGLGTSGFVQAIYIDDNYIYAGGNFAVAGSQTANRIARWNRNTLAWEVMGYGLSGNVNAIAHDGTYVYVGGNFETASDVENINEIMDNIARWSEPNGWEALGIGTDVGVTTLVNTLSFSSDNQELSVGGNFNTAGNVSTNNIALWGEALCTDNVIIPEYQINGTWQSGSNTLSVDEGSSLIISMLPNTTSFTITTPDSTISNGDLYLGTVVPNDSGSYIITTASGCQETLELTVNIVDTDNDGISETIDLCPNTPSGEAVDSNGCGESQKDDDNDGVFNNFDNCPNTPNGESVDSDGCAESQKDDDNDGVFNNVDICPNTPITETADVLGCGSSQQDIDGDGVINTEDLCNTTPTGEPVNADGCAESELDDDNDGISNADDLCPNTPNNDTVDAQGCGETQKDDDNDGVSNADDICPNTPSSETADSQGCGPSQQDIDNDGVPNSEDSCPNTPQGESVNEFGCSQTQLDTDNDGVSDAIDVCPNTPENSLVDDFGCVLSPIPENNFVIGVKSNSCIGSTDGVVEISSQLSLPFVARLTGVSFSETSPFTEALEFTNLPAGTFELCITTSDYPDYEICSTVIIEVPEPLSVVESVDPTNAVVNLKMSGAETFFVEINGFEFKTDSKELILNLEKGANLVKVRTEKSCQGTFEKEINLETSSILYPNPVENEIWISSNSFEKAAVVIKIYDMSGSLVFIENITASELQNPIYITDLTIPKGTYLLLLEQENLSQSFKLVKR